MLFSFMNLHSASNADKRHVPADPVKSTLLPLVYPC
jgi:hypothetical protein